MSRQPPGRGRAGGGAVRISGKRKPSSRRWLQRQLSDPYVAEARRRGYRSRAAFKLMEIDDRFRLLRPGGRVVDLGAAPGGWTEVAVERVRAASGGGRVIAVDLLEMAPVAGAAVIRGDLFEEATAEAIKQALGGPADVVLSDMAPPATGHAGADHLRAVALAEAALDFASHVLAGGGALVCKVFQGGAEASLLAEIKRRFCTVRHVKPPSSRKDSRELYLVATGFRGPKRRGESTGLAD